MSDYTELRPNAIYKPRLFIDGDKWCALYGANIQEGIVGFGDSPSDACISFNNAFTTPLTTGK